MRDHPSDLALDRMIDDLAALDDLDAAAVLDLLDPALRDQALRLLEGRRNIRGAFIVAPEEDADGQLSEWLRDRIQGQGAMTRMAHEALMAASRHMFGAAESAGRQRRPGPSLLSRMGSSLSGRGAL